MVKQAKTKILDEQILRNLQNKKLSYRALTSVIIDDLPLFRNQAYLQINLGIARKLSLACYYKMCRSTNLSKKNLYLHENFTQHI